MATNLGELARVLGLDNCGPVFDSFGTLPPPAASDDALAQPPATDAPTALAQLVRRGLDPSLVALVRQALASDRVACGLFAWDTLNASIVERGAARERLHADVAAVAAVLPKPRGAYVVLDAARGAPLAGAAQGPRILSVMRALGSSVAPGDTSAGALEAARSFARVLHRSHLSTMASFYLADLVFQQRHVRALPDLVETLLDAGAPQVEELVAALGDVDPNAEPSAIELATYARIRTRINAGKSAESLELAEKHRAMFAASRAPVDETARVNSRPTLAYTDAALRNQKPTVAFELIEAITRTEPAWRYAYRVLTQYAAQRTPSRDFLGTFLTFHQYFGNDYQAWYEVARGMPKNAEWAKSLLAILVRDVETLPHDAAIWQAAAMILGKGAAANDAFDEIEERLRDQATP